MESRRREGRVCRLWGGPGGEGLVCVLDGVRDGLTMVISGRTGVRQLYVRPPSSQLGSVFDRNVFISVDCGSASSIDARSLSILRRAEVNKRQARRGRKPLVHSALQNFE